MSYDLMVFDPASAPRRRTAFLEWYERLGSGDEQAVPSDDPATLTPPLHAWFLEMIETFPPLNGPLATGDVDDPKATDYGLAGAYVHASFAWSQAEAAFEQTVDLAAKHGVGVFNVSSDEGELWIPDPRGGLEPAPE